jgi:hypothetical protein
MEWTIVRLVVSENDGCRHNSEMELQGRTIETPFRTRRQSKTLCLEKTTLRVRAHVQTVGLNAEKKMVGFEPKEEISLLTFPLIGPYRFSGLAIKPGFVAKDGILFWRAVVVCPCSSA